MPNKKPKGMTDDEYMDWLIITGENQLDFSEIDEDIRNGQDDNYFLDED